MKATNRLVLATILCIFGILLCFFCVGNAASDSMIEKIGDYATIVETFYTTDEDSNNSYYIVWEKDNATGIMKVDSAYYEKYKDAETMPLEIKLFDSNKHYIYKRTDK